MVHIMNKCKHCNVMIYDETEVCPLCHSVLDEMSEEELQEMIEMLGQTGENALARIEKARPTLLQRLTAKRGRA